MQLKQDICLSGTSERKKNQSLASKTEGTDLSQFKRVAWPQMATPTQSIRLLWLDPKAATISSVLVMMEECVYGNPKDWQIQQIITCLKSVLTWLVDKGCPQPV